MLYSMHATLCYSIAQHMFSYAVPEPAVSILLRPLSRTPSRPRPSTSPEAPESPSCQQFESPQTSSPNTRARDSRRSVPTPLTGSPQQFYLIPQQFRWSRPPSPPESASPVSARPNARPLRTRSASTSATAAARARAQYARKWTCSQPSSTRTTSVSSSPPRGALSTVRSCVLPILFAYVRFMFFKATLCALVLRTFFTRVCTHRTLYIRTVQYIRTVFQPLANPWGVDTVNIHKSWLKSW